MGYYRAGFDVVGVDINPQPNYPFEFVQGDATDPPVDLGAFDAIHASPPCQEHSTMKGCHVPSGTHRLLQDTLDALDDVWQPWVVENVVGSHLPRSDDLFGRHGIELCGWAFGYETYRHRLFETSFPIEQPPHRPHTVPASRAGHWVPGTFISVAGNCYPVDLARRVMDIDWTTRDELAEAIPPYFTEFIGTQLLQHINAKEFS